MNEAADETPSGAGTLGGFDNREQGGGAHGGARDGARFGTSLGRAAKSFGNDGFGFGLALRFVHESLQG